MQTSPENGRKRTAMKTRRSGRRRSGNARADASEGERIDPRATRWLPALAYVRQPVEGVCVRRTCGKASLVDLFDAAVS
jgi:hypothetical protein